MVSKKKTASKKAPKKLLTEAELKEADKKIASERGTAFGPLSVIGDGPGQVFGSS